MYSVRPESPAGPLPPADLVEPEHPEVTGRRRAIPAKAAKICVETAGKGNVTFPGDRQTDDDRVARLPDSLSSL